MNETVKKKLKGFTLVEVIVVWDNTVFTVTYTEKDGFAADKNVSNN